MKISVITVCYNSEKYIESTIRSVLSQTYNDMEYIIIDGASTDNTPNILDKALANSDNVICISEPDSGLYNAMNKGIRLATGDYLIFMNSGDVFTNSHVLSDIHDQLTSDIVYGNVIRISNSGDIKETYNSSPQYIKWLLLKGKMICHQAMFIKRSIMLNYMYDESYKITADFNFLCKCIANKHSLRYCNIDICKMDNISGISSEISNLPVMWEEDDRSIHQYFPFWYYMLFIPKKIIRNCKSIIANRQ